MAEDKDPKEDVKDKESNEPKGPSQEEFDKMQTDLKEANKLNEDLTVVANVVAGDENLRAGFQTKYAEMTGQEPEKKEPKKEAKKEVKEESKKEAKEAEVPKEYDSLSEKVNNIERTQRADVVKEFETTTGILKLSKEDQVKARQRLEAQLNKWGHSAKQTPTDSLGDLLMDAYKVAYQPEILERASQAGAANIKTNATGSMGTFNSFSTNDAEDEVELTSAQRKWADKLNVDAEKATKRKQEILDDK